MKAVKKKVTKKSPAKIKVPLAQQIKTTAASHTPHEYLQNIFMQSPFAFSVMKGKDMVVTHANKLMKTFWGKGDDVEGKTLLEILPELIDQPFPAMLDSVYTTGKPVYADEILARLNHNGKIEDRYFNIVYKPHLEADETISGVITIAHEVTNEVLARRKIEESEERFQAAVAAVQGIVWTNNPKGEMEGEQLGWSALTGQSYEEYQGFGWANAIHPDDAQPTIDAWNKAVRDRKNFVFEHRVKLKNGNWGHFSVKAIPLLNQDGLIREWVGVHTDISAQKQAEVLVKESEYRYQNMVYSSPSLIAIFKGEDMIIEIANDAVLESWGKGKDIIGKPVFEVMPETAEQGFDKILLNVYTTGEPFYAYETPVTLVRNGKPQLMHYTFVYQAQRNMNGVIEGVAVLANEVTPQVEAKNKLKESEAFSRSVLNSSPDCIKILDAEGRLQFMNENGICLMEIDDFSQFKNKLWRQLWEDKNQQIIKDAVTKALSGERVQFQAMGNTAKGNPKWWDVIVAPILIDGAIEKVQRIISVSRDITDFKDAMLKVEESEKRYSNLIAFSSSAIGILQGEDMIITTANNAIIAIWGKGNDVFGKKYFDLLPELAEQGYREVFAEVYKTGKPFSALETPVNILQNGKMELKYYNFILQAQRNLNGEIEGVGIIANEVTSQALLNLKIKAREEQFRLLVEQAPVAICVLRGKDYVIEIINEGMTEMWDRTLEQAINKPAFDVLPELKEQGFKELLDNVYNTGERYVVDELPIQLMRNRKLENLFVKFIYEPLREADGSISGVMALAHEITEQVLSRKKIEESATKFRTLIEDAPVATCLFTGREMKIELANDIMIGYWGKDKNVIGKPLADAVPELKGQPFLQILDDVFTTGKVYESKNAYTQLELNGELGDYYFDFTYKPIFNAAGEVYGIMDMAVDVTEQVIAKNKNQETHLQRETELDAKVKQRTIELKRANESLLQKLEELKRLNKELESFSYISGHDLQEPLRKIQTFIGRLVEKENEALSDKGKDYFNRIQGESVRMRTLINDLLAFSRIGTAELKFESTDLTSLIKEVTNEYKEVIKQKKAVIEIQEICDVKTIPFQFRQLLHNLISNALKFSNPKIPPHISIKSESIIGLPEGLHSPFGREGVYFHLSISDNGIGFEKQYSKKIFEVFQRLHGREEYPGTGIGLAIVKKIVDNHKGIITATSVLNKGATFNIYIPAR